MAVFYETIPESLIAWILAQKLLWVGSAPLSASGHINISPKGGPDFFGILNPTTFWYMDLTGSGVETTAHLHEPGNGRICVMFIAFEGPPRIVRIWGKGRVMENGTAEYEAFVKEHKVKTIPGSRSIVVVDVHQVGSSCGYSVPYYEWKGWRNTLNEVFAKKEKKYLEGNEDESMDRYWAFKSQLSIDGLPGMKRGYEFAQKHQVAPLKKMVGKHAPTSPRTAHQITALHLVLVGILCVVIGAAGAVTMVSPETVRSIQHKELLF